MKTKEAMRGYDFATYLYKLRLMTSCKCITIFTMLHLLLLLLFLFICVSTERYWQLCILCASGIMYYFTTTSYMAESTSAYTVAGEWHGLKLDDAVCTQLYVISKITYT